MMSTPEAGVDRARASERTGSIGGNMVQWASKLALTSFVAIGAYGVFESFTHHEATTNPLTLVGALGATVLLAARDNNK